MCSTFISLNGNALTGPRAYFAMARDGLFPGGLCRVHPTVPDSGQCDPLPGNLGDPPDGRRHVLIVVPPPAAGARPARPDPGRLEGLNETPLYDLLYTYVIFGANLFYMLAISSVFVLRIRRPDLPRPYRTLGYPLTPLLYVAGALLLLGNMLADHQSRVQSLVGLGIILLGLPAYFITLRRSAGASSRGSVRSPIQAPR